MNTGSNMLRYSIKPLVVIMAFILMGFVGPYLEDIGVLKTAGAGALYATIVWGIMTLALTHRNYQ